jgi:type II secretory pathway pseudopilin PulG
MRRLRDESGFTIVEGVVACLLITIGGLATLQIFTASAQNTFRSEQSQVVNTRLQAELEKIKALPYSQVAMTESVGPVSNPNDPRSRISGAGFAVQKGTTTFSPMEVDASNGKVVPGPTPFESGDVKGHLYRFVTWVNDPQCPESSCPGTQDLKRVVVAATLADTPSTSARPYQEMQADLADPDAVPVDPGNPNSGGGGGPLPGPGDPGDCPSSGCTDVPSQFWLTDTPCNFTSRQPITEDHPLHNTRANCSQGLGNGSVRGAPDLMFTQAPRLDENYGPSQQPQFDYATDVEPPSNGALDKGLIIRPQSGLLSTGCVASPLLDATNLTRYVDFALTEPNPEQKMHKWLSASVPTDRSLVMTGEGTLSLWTRTVNGATYDGKICIWLFVRTTVNVPLLGSVRTDVPLVHLPSTGVGEAAFWTESRSPWPSQWTEIEVDLSGFDVPPLDTNLGVTLNPGDRLGLAIAVDRGGTGSTQGLEFLYDHPNFDSRLEVTTQALLPF